MNIVHLHLLLNHVPVVGALVSLLLFAATLLMRGAVSTKFALAFTTGIAVIAIAVYFTGGPAEEVVEKLAGVSEKAIDRHEKAAEMTTVATGILGALSLLALVVFRAKPAPRWVAFSGLAGTVVISALLGWTANLGGQIRHTEIQGAYKYEAIREK